MLKQVLCSGRGDVLRGSYRNQSGGERRCCPVRWGVFGEQGKHQQETGSWILDPFGYGARTVDDADEITPRQRVSMQIAVPAGDLPGTAPARMCEQVVDSVVADKIAIDDHGLVPALNRHPEHRPPVRVHEQVGHGVDISSVVAEPLRLSTRITATRAPQVVRPEARTVYQWLSGDQRATLVSLNQHVVSLPSAADRVRSGRPTRRFKRSGTAVGASSPFCLVSHTAIREAAGVLLPLTHHKTQVIEVVHITDPIRHLTSADLVGDEVAIWEGERARQTLSLIADLPGSELYRCFVPGWGIRAHSSTDLLFEIAFCFRCHRVRIWGPDVSVEQEGQTFDAEGPTGLELLRLFRSCAPN
ncbi:hypothetical protein [Streptomyces sp. NPDC057072]|uniref:hypothetical protein n=1 Tax=Streptomyces sp. NPDC057072 TaxID=3346014 RepID=UPI0036296814